MVLIELISRWFEQNFCQHRTTIIRKYNSEGTKLPVEQQYYYCLSCHKSLENLNYLSNEKY